MNKSFALVFCFFLGFIISKAQNPLKFTLSGKVVDLETKEPLPFASIGILGKSIGTISNLQGEFDFHIPSEYRNDIFVINMMGFQSFEAPVWSLLEKPQVIELKKSVLILKEVVVRDSLTGGDIMRIALGRIEENYPMQPFLMDGFYRDLKKVAGTYISLLEAAVSIYDEDYARPRNQFKLHERVALKEVRRSYGYGNKFTAFFDQDNLLEDLLLNNNIRYRQIPEEEIFLNGLERDADSYYNGDDVFVVTNTKEYSLKVYIDKKTFGIIHLEYENNAEEPLNRKRNLNSKFVSLKRTIDFKSYQGKFYLNYLSVDSKINWYNNQSGALEFETELQRQLLINNVTPHAENFIGTMRKMKSYGLQYQDLPYNQSFWDNYNVIKETPLDKKIISDLEKAGPLERQFKNE